MPESEDESYKTKQGFVKFIETSAKSGESITELLKYLVDFSLKNISLIREV